MPRHHTPEQAPPPLSRRLSLILRHPCPRFINAVFLFFWITGLYFTYARRNILSDVRLFIHVAGGVVAIENMGLFPHRVHRFIVVAGCRMYTPSLAIFLSQVNILVSSYGGFEGLIGLSAYSSCLLSVLIMYGYPSSVVLYGAMVAVSMFHAAEDLFSRGLWFCCYPALAMLFAIYSLFIRNVPICVAEPEVEALDGDLEEQK